MTIALFEQINKQFAITSQEHALALSSSQEKAPTLVAVETLQQQLEECQKKVAKMCAGFAQLDALEGQLFKATVAEVNAQAIAAKVDVTAAQMARVKVQLNNTASQVNSMQASMSSAVATAESFREQITKTAYQAATAKASSELDYRHADYLSDRIHWIISRK